MLNFILRTSAGAFFNIIPGNDDSQQHSLV